MEKTDDEILNIATDFLLKREPTISIVGASDVNRLRYTYVIIYYHTLRNEFRCTGCRLSNNCEDIFQYFSHRIKPEKDIGEGIYGSISLSESEKFYYTKRFNLTKAAR